LMRLLGRGGMGSVYLAERADGELHHSVAIKLLRFGADELSFHDRFLRERQILASLNHPGIAKLLDVGRTNDGQPYLVMEYIDGKPIDVYAERVDLREKITLFLQVCEAVSYAHRNLIVHRDLKPSNILVDASGRPKLLDFGIAKILNAAQDQTQTRDRLLTPEYASPEHIRGDAQTAAADVYSLGAVLYKLLTGRSPHVLSSQADIESAICRTEPERVSRVNPAVPKDLDFVLGTALRKEPDERYASADAFADDLRAFLEWRPIRARSGDMWYRSRKFVRRYRLLVAAVALTVIGLSIGLYVANRERGIAQRRFMEVRQLANKLIDLDADIRDVPGATKGRSRIVSTSLEYLGALGPAARGDKDLSLEIADAYRQLAGIQGVPIHSNLGQFSEARESLRKADAFVESVLTIEAANRRAMLASAQIAHDGMAIANIERNIPEVLEYAHRAERQLEQLTSERNLRPEEIAPIARIYANLAIAYGNGHRFDDCIRSARRGIEIASGVPSARTSRSLAVGALASALRWTGDLDGALQTVRESRKILEATPDRGLSYRMNSIELLSREGRILGEYGEVSLDRPAEGIPLLQQSLDLAEEIAEKDPHDASSRQRVALMAEAIGDLLRSTDPAKALVVYDKGLARIREAKTNLDAQRIEVALLAGSAYALRRLHRANEAEKQIEAAFRILNEIKDYPAERIVAIDASHIAVRAMADHFAETGRLQKAAETYRELLEKVMASAPDPENDLRNAKIISDDQMALVDILQRLGRIQEAADLQARRQGLWESWQRKLPNNAYVQRQMASGATK
jgi:tetratricopeptide (TPR) repeat protein/predicted Ser/Thr protein kinase